MTRTADRMHMDFRFRAVLFSSLMLVFALVTASCGGADQTVLAGPSVQPADRTGAPTLTQSEEVDESAPEANAAEAEQPGEAADEETLQLPEGFFDGVEIPQDSTGAAGTEGSESEETTPLAEPSGLSMNSLKSAAAATEASESYRFDLSMGWSVSGAGLNLTLPDDTPMMSGKFVDGASSIVFDLGPMMDAMMASFGETQDIAEELGGDLTMQMVDDGQGRLYMRAPMFAALADDPSMPADFAALGTGWGVIDLAKASGVSATDLADLTGAQGASSPSAMLDLLRGAGTVDDMGTAQVRGVETDHVRVSVDFASLLRAQGMDDAEFQLLTGTDPSALANFTIPFDVYVDADGLVRRMIIEIDAAAIDGLYGAGATGGTEFVMTTTMDFYGYNGDFAIDIPSPDEVAVDLSETMAALLS